MDQLNQDFLEFIKLLEEEQVEYLVVGGYAVGGLEVKFIGKEDLIRNKTATARPKDRIDVEELGKDP